MGSAGGGFSGCGEVVVIIPGRHSRATFPGDMSPGKINVGTDKKRCHNRLNKGRMDLEYSKQVQEELLISNELDKMPIDGAQELNYVVLIDKP
ncbi:hypothetical protein Tco_0393802 [Tanacetum coccineum]